MIEAQAIRAAAARLGLGMVGITRAEPSPTLDAYLRWIAAGMHGEMGYMARPDRQARRRDLGVIVPGARTLVMVAVDYHTFALPAAIANDPARGRIAAYAWGQDYHDILTPRLKQLAEELRALSPGGKARVYVDTGAILERSHAQQAGLGFIGKNTLLINPRRGSYMFLGTLVTDIACDSYDTPHRATMCGSCVRCQDACPTAAFPTPYVLDARRCISYLTIEYKGSIPRELRGLMGNWVMGCDICQDVCPWQRFATPASEPAFALVDLARAAPSLCDLLALDEAGFAARFVASPLERMGRERLVRNACVAAGNWGDPACAPQLVALLEDPSPLIRAHAAWALGHNKSPAASDALRVRLASEADPEVCAELRAALDEAAHSRR